MGQRVWGVSVDVPHLLWGRGNDDPQLITGQLEGGDCRWDAE